jgi:hypothetical protein
MSRVIEPPSLRGGGQEIKSQVALELLLNAYAIVGTAVVLRCLLRALGVGDHVWLGRTVYRLTSPLAAPLALLPGGSFQVHRSLTVADLTLLALLILLPLGAYARGARAKRRA